VAEQRDDFPNNFVGDLVPTEQLPVLNCSRTLTLPSLSAATLMFHHRHSRTAAQSLPSLIRFSPSA
jgi:hypothetical protein